MTAPEPINDGLRVLFVSHWFPRNEMDWGGIFVLEQAQSLRAAGVDVRVLVAEPKPAIAWRKPGSIARGFRDFFRTKQPQWQMQRGVPVAYVPMLTPHPWAWGALAPRSYIASLVRWRKALLADFKPQIVHAHTAFLDGYPAAWLARRLRVPMILGEATGPFSAIMTTPAQRRLTALAVNGADLLIPISDFQRRTMASAITLSPDLPIRILNYGFDPRIFHPSPLPPASPFRFVWIGQLNDNKQPLMLVEAFSLALKTRDDLRLTLIGHGPLEADVRQRIAAPELSGRIVLKPPTGRDGIAAALREHGALVASARTETFGVVIIEALGSGRPVLTTRSGGPEEIVESIHGGIVVDNTPDALASGLLRMADEAPRYDPVGLAEQAASLHSLDIVAQTLAAIYVATRKRNTA